MKMQEGKIMKKLICFLFLVSLFVLVLASSGPTASAQFDPYAAQQASHDEEDRIEQRRLETARAFREYVETKVSNGENILLSDLENFRMMLAGGDPYLTTYIPEGAALRELVEQANKRSQLNRMKTDAEIRRFQADAEVTPSNIPDTSTYLGLLKTLSSYVGFSEACNNSSDAADAIRFYDAVLMTAFKHSALKPEDEEFIRDLGRKSALEAKNSFTTNPPVTCAEVHKGLTDLKSEAGLD